MKARAEKGEREKEEANEINWRDAEAAVCFLNEQPICILNFAPEENGRSRVANNKYIDNRERVGKRVEKEFLSEREIKFSGHARAYERWRFTGKLRGEEYKIKGESRRDPSWDKGLPNNKKKRKKEIKRVDEGSFGWLSVFAIIFD